MKTIHSFLEYSAIRLPNKVALVHNNKRITYAELNTLANKIRNFLAKKTKKHSTIALIRENSIEYLVAYFGILKAGCICVPLDAAMSGEEILSRLQIVSPAFVLSQDSLINKKGIESKSFGFIDIENLLKTNFVARTVNVSEEDYSTIMFSSGTTGEPKGVLLKHKNIVAATESIVEYLKITENDVDVNALKLSHSFGLGNIHCYFRQGGQVILEKNFVNLRGFLHRILDENATSFSATPYVLGLLVRHCDGTLQECGKVLRYVVNNTNVLHKEIGMPLLEILPETKIYTYYGLTEASRSTFHLLEKKDPSRLESAGKASPGVAIKITDDSDKEVCKNEIGEVLIKGRHVIEKYWKNEELTEKTIINGWLHAGDLGYFDNAGFLFIVGRKDDVINVGGDKVYPIDVEKVICSHPFVKDCAVTPAPDNLMGQVVAAHVVLDASRPQNVPDKNHASNIIRFCGGKMEGFKIPKHIYFHENIPATESGKKKRKVLRNDIK